MPEAGVFRIKNKPVKRVDPLTGFEHLPPNFDQE
jgi:hypothetical protein